MYYCFCAKKVPKEWVQREINRAIQENSFLYYDSKRQEFLNEKDTVVDISNCDVMPISNVLQLKEMITSLEKKGAKIPNTWEDLEKIETWYQYIEPTRELVAFRGAMLEDAAFATYLLELFLREEELFLKTVKKDFSGTVTLKDLLNPESDLRNAFSYHAEDEFLLSKKVKLDQDELGTKEYRIFVKEGEILNISRYLDSTYHQIPKAVLDYANAILEMLPEEFPKTFTLDVFSYEDRLDIAEFNPLEGSGKYLYNSVFEKSSDLLHEEITKVPLERQTEALSFERREEAFTASTLEHVENTFAKDLRDISMFGERQTGYCALFGLPKPNGVHISLASLLKDWETVKQEEEVQKSLSKKK